MVYHNPFMVNYPPPQEIPALLNSSHARVRLLAVNSIQGGAWTSYAWSVHARATADMTWA